MTNPGDVSCNLSSDASAQPSTPHMCLFSGSLPFSVPPSHWFYTHHCPVSWRWTYPGVVRLLCILAVVWVHQIGEASRTSESRKRRRSGCLVPHFTPILPQTWHLLCPHISHSDLLSLLLGHPPSYLQAPATLFLDLPLTLRIVPADPSLGCLQLHALHVSSLLPEPYRFSTALVFLLSGEDFAMAITPN